MTRETTSNVCCGMGGLVCGLAFLLWLGLTPAMAGLSLLGLKMASMSPIVLPLAIVALGLISSGLWLGAKSHGHGEPFMVSLVGAAATVLGMTVAPAVATFGLLIVAGSIGWNQLLLSRRQPEQAS